MSLSGTNLVLWCCRSSPYLSVGRNKFWRKNHVKAHYAFKEQVAMVDFTYNESKASDKPLAKVSQEHSAATVIGKESKFVWEHFVTFAGCRRHTSRQVLARRVSVH